MLKAAKRVLDLQQHLSEHLAAILFHFMANLSAEIANKTERTTLYSTLLWIGAAIAVAWLWGADTASGRDVARR